MDASLSKKSAAQRCASPLSATGVSAAAATAGFIWFQQSQQPVILALAAFGMLSEEAIRYIEVSLNNPRARSVP